MGRRIAAALTVVGALLTPAIANGHVERPAYFPDPAADSALRGAGGEVPKARSLASALKAKPPGRTRAVCQKDSRARPLRSIDKARRDGYAIRPNDKRRLSAKQARRLKRINRA